MGLLDFFKTAGAPTEESTDRSGAFSWHAETHAFAVGLGLAWIAVVTGDLELLGAVMPAVTAGLHAKDRNFSKILTDVKQEWHYFVGAVPVGGLIGAFVRYSLGLTSLPV